MTQINRTKRTRKGKRISPPLKRQVGCLAAVRLHNNKMKAERERE